MKRNMIVVTVIMLVLALVMSTACAKAEFEVSSLEITPSNVGTGDTATVKVDVTNVGKAEGTYIATLSIDGALVETKDSIVSPETTQTVAFSVVKGVVGDYTAEVGGLTGTLHVVKPAEFVVTDLQVVLAPELEEGYYRITVDVENVGALKGIYQLRSEVNDEEMEPVKVELTAGERKTVTLIGAESTIHRLAANYKDDEIDQREHAVSIEDLTETVKFAARPVARPIARPIAPAPDTPPPKPVIKLHLLHSYGYWEGGNYVYVQGEVKNISDESLADVEAVISVYTSEGKLFSSDSRLIDKNPLLPGQTSFFLVGTDGDETAKRYRLWFRFSSGDEILFENVE